MKPVWILAIAACGDNRLIPDASVADQPVDTIAAPPDAMGKPDLSLVAGMMQTILFTNDTFTAGSCEMVEQCIGAIGTRRLLRFDTVTANLGTSDLVIGVPPPAGVSVPPFEWSACHGHHHFTGFAIYELLDGTDVVVAGHKQAFCIADSVQVTPGAPTTGYDCGNQGLSTGWADIYARSLPCQWIDVTDVPAGDYTLRVRVNPDAAIEESDLTNNEFTKQVTL